MNSIQNEEQIGSYIIMKLQRIGKGSYGSVYIARHKQTNELVACKIIKKEDVDQSIIERERKILYDLSSMSHKNDNLVQLLEYDVTKSSVYLFSEYCDGGNLKDLMNEKKELQQNNIENNNLLPSGFTRVEVQNIMTDIVNCYRFLHQKSIVHRDLKPENILIKNKKFKLGDFGFAKQIQGNYQLPTEMTGNRFTPIYGAPQVFIILNPSQEYSALCDVWSLGIIFYELIFGEKPYPQNISDMGQLIYQLKLIRESKIWKPQYKECPEDLWQLVCQMLEYEEKDRITWDKCFKAQFFQIQKQQQYKFIVQQKFIESQNKINQFQAMDSQVYKKNIIQQFNRDSEIFRQLMNNQSKRKVKQKFWTKKIDNYINNQIYYLFSLFYRNDIFQNYFIFDFWSRQLLEI